MSKQATFTEMLNGTAEDYAIIGEQTSEYAQQLPDRILEHLSILKGDTGGFAVDRFTHCLQTATRAYKDGRDEEYIVCALLHDIGDTIASANHADLAATMLEPFVSELQEGRSKFNTEICRGSGWVITNVVSNSQPKLSVIIKS